MFASHSLHEHITSSEFVVRIAFEGIGSWNRKVRVLSYVLHSCHRTFRRQFEILRGLLWIGVPNSAEPDDSVVEFNFKYYVEEALREPGAEFA